jgi:parvulin-like peptidyl-prolyl isomerase
MKIRYTVAAAVLVAFPALAQAPKIDEDAPVIKDGPVQVDEGDILAFIQRVPEEQRGTFRISYDRIAAAADSVFVARSLAQKARDEGLDKDPLVRRRMQQAQDTLLADVYSAKLKDDVAKLDLGSRARELYAADAEAYRTPETVTVQHIMVSGMWRTREQARERIRDFYDQVKHGADFLELAQRYSDDRSKTANGGTLPPIEPQKFNVVTRDAIAKLRKGDVTPPIEDDSGFHLFKLVERKMPEVPKFEEVRERIIANARDRVLKERAEALLQQIRSSTTVLTYQANLDALVIPVDTELLNKAQSEIVKQTEAKKRAQQGGAPSK